MQTTCKMAEMITNKVTKKNKSIFYIDIVHIMRDKFKYVSKFVVLRKSE